MSDETVPKIKISEYKENDPTDALDWLRAAEFIIKINRGTLTDGAIVQMLLSAITATELRMKLIDEMTKDETEEVTFAKFKEVFRANVRRDVITYRNDLNNLKYKEENNMREFYSKIFNLVSKAMKLEPETDKSSIEKLAMNEFITKIPLKLKSAMQINHYETGEDMADAAEKIRSFQRLYLAKDTEINNINENDGGNEPQCDTNYEHSNGECDNQEQNNQNNNQHQNSNKHNNDNHQYNHNKHYNNNRKFNTNRQHNNNRQHSNNQNRYNNYHNDNGNNDAGQITGKFCNYCKQTGHLLRECRIRIRNNKWREENGYVNNVEKPEIDMKTAQKQLNHIMTMMQNMSTRTERSENNDDRFQLQ